MHKYKKISKNIEEILIDNPITESKRLSWINIKNAGKNEIEYLRKKFKFDLPYLQASSAKASSQRPIVRSGKGYLFVILHFPVYRNEIIESEEIEFFITRDHLVTIHNDELTSLKKFFSLCKKDGEALLSYKLESSAILMYELLDALISNCFKLLDDNTILMREVEGIIFSQNQKIATSKILYLRRNIINFRRIMQSHKNIMKKIVELEKSIIPADKLRTYYTTLINRTKRIWEMLENQKEMIEALHDTNESMLNYKISDIMKTLTVFSVIVFPLTLFAAIFGMNTIDSMPFVDNENGFWQIIILMTIGCFFMLLFFKKKKWL